MMVTLTVIDEVEDTHRHIGDFSMVEVGEGVIKDADSGDVLVRRSGGDWLTADHERWHAVVVQSADG